MAIYQRLLEEEVLLLSTGNETEEKGVTKEANLTVAEANVTKEANLTVAVKVTKEVGNARFVCRSLSQSL